MLDVAKDIFTEQGLEATMPRVAAAAGIGVGSLYRCYGSKEDLVAALVIRQLDVGVALGELSLAWQQLIDRAREEGTVRSDATVTDLRFVFAAARAADEVEAGGRDRVLTLMLEALRR